MLVICDGWAVRFVQLPNGKRQILSVLMPGDLVSPTSMLEGQLAFSIQAVTDVRYCYLSVRRSPRPDSQQSLIVRRLAALDGCRAARCRQTSRRPRPAHRAGKDRRADRSCDDALRTARRIARRRISVPVKPATDRRFHRPHAGAHLPCARLAAQERRLRRWARPRQNHGPRRVAAARDRSNSRSRRRLLAPARYLPRQFDDDKSRGGERDHDDGARRPRTERGDERRNLLRRQISRDSRNPR